MQKYCLSWTYWVNCEEVGLDWRDCSSQKSYPTCLFGSTKKSWDWSQIQVVTFSPTPLLQNFYLLEHQHRERRSVLIMHARFRYRPARCMISIRGLVIKDLLLHGVSYLWNISALLWQYEWQKIESRPFLMARLRGRACWAILLFLVVTQKHLGCMCAENTF